MSADHAERPVVLPRPNRARVAARVLGVVVAALVAYAAWRGYHSPDFLLGVAAAFGLC
jgi:heme A synthase